MRFARMPLLVLGTGIGLAGLASLVGAVAFRDAVNWLANGGG